MIKLIQISSHSCPCQSKTRAPSAVSEEEGISSSDTDRCELLWSMIRQLVRRGLSWANFNTCSQSSDGEVWCACADRTASHSQSITAILCSVKKFYRNSSTKLNLLRVGLNLRRDWWNRKIESLWCSIDHAADYAALYNLFNLIASWSFFYFKVILIYLIWFIYFRRLSVSLNSPWSDNAIVVFWMHYSSRYFFIIITFLLSYK